MTRDRQIWGNRSLSRIFEYIKIISVDGISPDIAREFDAIIDTGFTGFLSMPLVEAFPLGLVLSGTTSTILADGSSSFKLTALGTVQVESETRLGTILLNLGSGPCDVLIGMEFIAAFSKTPFLHQRHVVLFDNADIEEVIKKALSTAETPPEQMKLPTPKSPQSQNPTDKD